MIFIERENEMNLSGLKHETATDLIKLINGAKGFEKTGTASFTAGKGSKTYSWVLLDDILEYVKSNENFGLMQPLGQDELGRPSIKNILIHITGEVIASEWFPLGYKEDESSQNKGIIITYMRRYSLGAFLGLSSETDNDGDTTIKNDDELAEKIVAEKKIKAQKQVTDLFNDLLKEHGNKQAVYDLLGTTREQFLLDFQSAPIELLGQVKNYVK